jgi:hypothetical protein
LFGSVTTKVQPQEKGDYMRFIQAFHDRYEEELKHAGLIPETEIFQLYLECKASGKTPDQWLEQQELS